MMATIKQAKEPFGWMITDGMAEMTNSVCPTKAIKVLMRIVL